MNDQVSLDLEATQAILEQRGWCQHSPTRRGATRGAPVCVEGALAQAVFGDDQLWAVREGDFTAWDGVGYRLVQESDVRRFAAALSALCRAIPEDRVRLDGTGRFCVWGFNDAPSTALEDVKLLLKRAIEGASR